MVDVLLNFFRVLTSLSLSNFLFSDFKSLISDFNIFIYISALLNEIWKTTYIFFKRKTTLIVFCKWKTTSIFL